MTASASRSIGTVGADRSVRDGWVRFGRQAVLPMAGWTLANVAGGRLLAANARLTSAETELLRRLQGTRTPARDRTARLASLVSDVPATVLHGLIAVAVIRRAAGDGRAAALPAAALALQTGLYLAAGALVGRPRPAVERLDREQPTSSFPSGHVGANVALLMAYLILARADRRPLVVAGAVTAGTLLGWSRLYVGMHYPSDVAAGVVNGVVAATLSARGLGLAGRGPNC